MSDLTDSRKRKITDVDSLHSETESNKKARTADPPSGADDICNICRKDTDLLYCLGACRRAYHRSCLNLAPDHTAHYYCNECINNTRTCFICHDTSDPSPPQKCCLLICGKFYHENCVRSNSLTKTGKESGTFICPRHVCQVCRGEGAKSDQPLLYCFDCCAAYHASCQPDIDVLSHMYCLCGKCQRVKSVKSGAEQPSMTPVTINAASTAYNNPLDPRLPSYKPNLIVELTNQVPVEPVPLAASSVDDGELVQSELALPTDSAEIERLANMDEWDLLDMGYNDAQVKELKQRVTPPPSRGGFRGRGRGRGSFDGSRDSFRSRNRNSREKDKPRDLRDSRSYSSHTSDRRSPSPSRSRHSPYHTSRTWSDRTPSPHSSSHRRSPSPLRSSRTYRDKSPDSRDRDKSRYSHRYSPPPPPSPAPTLAPPPPPQPASVELTTSKVQQSYQPLTAAPLLELTKHNKLICVLDMITVSGPKLEMPAQLELMSVVPVNIVKTIAANTSIIKTVIKLTPRPGSEAQCENLLYYLHQSGKAELFTLTTRHKVFVFSNKEDFITDLTFKRDPVCLMAIGLYQTDLNFL